TDNALRGTDVNEHLKWAPSTHTTREPPPLDCCDGFRCNKALLRSTMQPDDERTNEPSMDSLAGCAAVGVRSARARRRPTRSRARQAAEAGAGGGSLLRGQVRSTGLDGRHGSAATPYRPA